MVRRWATAGAVLLAACTGDGAGPDTTVALAVSWMEWPAEVSATQPGSIRIVGYHGICGTLELDVTQSGPSSVSVEADQRFDNDPPAPCPAVIAILDTVMPLPRLVTPTGPTGFFSIDAMVVDPLGGTSRRIFGQVQLTDQAPNTALQLGGRALVKADSLGCSWARSDIPGIAGPYVLSSDLVLDNSQWYSAFISGEFSAALTPRCGQDPLLSLRLVEVDAAP